MKQLTFSKKSIADIRKISEYIEVKFSLRIKSVFLEKLRKNFDYIFSSPESFPLSEYENLRKCVVTKQTSIFYKIEGIDKIYIVSVFDTRQNQNKINKTK
ncbi:type II toxin-antitoxin system RelE/ParE family toxin [Flavobacterium tegetincola]|uniref:type II toxin-antitoxin system RelE/ParE family toxin n=1 Tax=Flavobacterium tegetincola TaxID=150172 RepID=UPI000405E8B0|nr:type II toxin-antitoxin system RelE/ParE family toxin [Flavobacterium tegetincola]